VPPLDGLIHGGLVGDIERQSQHPLAVFFVEVVQAFDAARSGDDLVAAFQRGLCPDASETFGCSRNKPNFVHDDPLAVEEVLPRLPLAYGGCNLKAVL